MQQDAHWNAVRFDAQSNQGHVESYFLKANSPDGQAALWIKATILAMPGRAAHAVAEAWAVVFRRGAEHVAVKQSMPCGDATFGTDRLEVLVGRYIEMTEDTTRGDISFGGHQVEWNLRMEGNGPALVMYPLDRMYTGAFPKSKLVSPKPDLRLRGWAKVDGQAVEVDGWRGMQGHNWGRGHADQYAWGHCNQWERDDADTLIEAVSGRVRVGRVLTPMMTLVYVRHAGKQYAMTGMLDLLRNRGEIHPRRWFVKACSRGVTIECDFSAQTADMVGLYYANPDGAMTYCLNSKLANARLHLALEGRDPLDLTSRAAAFELGTRDPDHGVRMYV